MPHEKNYHLTKLDFLALKFQGVPALSSLPAKDRQQSIDLHINDT